MRPLVSASLCELQRALPLPEVVSAPLGLAVPPTAPGLGPAQHDGAAQAARG